MSSNHKYVPLTSAETDTERYVHFLLWAYKNRPGERISKKEIAQSVSGVKRPSPQVIVGVGHRFYSIAKILREKYRLGWSATQDGVLILDTNDSIARSDFLPAVREFGSKQRKVDSRVDLMEARGGADGFSKTKEGRKLAAIYTGVKGQIGRLRLPSNNEIRGLLVSDTDE